MGGNLPPLFFPNGIPLSFVCPLLVVWFWTYTTQVVVIVGRFFVARSSLRDARVERKVTQHAPSANEVLARAVKSLMMCDF